MMCSSKDIVFLAPVFAVFFLAFCLAVVLSIWGLGNTLEDTEETERSPNPSVTRTLNAMKDFIVSPNRQNEKCLVQSLQRMRLQDKVDLLKDTYNVEIKGQDTKGQMMKTAVEKIFSLKSEEKAILLLMKNSDMPTAFKTRVIDLLKIGTITKTKNYLSEKIPPKEMAYMKLVINIGMTSAGILSLPSQDIKDLAFISLVINFYNNVIQQRTSMIDDIDLPSIIGLLLVIYALVQLLRLTISGSTPLPIRIPRCFPFGFKCNPGWIPFFTEVFLNIRRIRYHWQIFTSKLAIIQGLEEILQPERDTIPLWNEVQNQSSYMNRIYNELESLDLKEKKIKITSVLGDIVQGAVLLVLLLRSDLRIRGVLGLAKLAGTLNVDTRSHDTSGKKKSLFRIFIFFLQIMFS